MTELSKRISDRILSSDNFENVAYVCCDWEEFVFEVAEWGVDHIAGVDFFDTYKSFRDYTFNPELDIKKLDTFIREEG